MAIRAATVGDWGRTSRPTTVCRRARSTTPSALSGAPSRWPHSDPVDLYDAPAPVVDERAVTRPTAQEAQHEWFRDRQACVHAREPRTGPRCRPGVSADPEPRTSAPASRPCSPTWDGQAGPPAH